MNMEKLKYSKCPNCKKYGIGVSRGIRYHYTKVETCQYCGKKYQVNWALAFILNISIPIIWGVICLLINTYLIEIPFWIIIILFLCIYYLIIRICPMEEVKDKK